MDKHTFSIRLDNKDAVEKELRKLSRKASKYNVPFEYEWGQVIEEQVQILEPTPCQSPSGGLATMLFPVHKYWVEAQELHITLEPIHQSGWTILAHIEHIEESDQRVVTLISATETDPLWRTWDMRCDHCGTHRMRKAVYICKHDDGRVVSVGSTCLREYTGIDPASVFSWALVHDVIIDPYEGEGGWSGRPWNPRYDIREVLAYAIQEVHDAGYIKSGQPMSTRDRVEEDFSCEEKVKPENLARADLIIQWVMAQEPYSDYMSNCQAICQCKSVETKRFGYLCYLPVAYDNATKTTNVINNSVSEYVGTVGDKLQLSISEMKAVTSWDTQWGCTTLYKIVDQKGNVYTWKTSAYVDVDKAKELKGTVKTHSEYKGVRQTELTRCKVS